MKCNTTVIFKPLVVYQFNFMALYLSQKRRDVIITNKIRLNFQDSRKLQNLSHGLGLRQRFLNSKLYHNRLVILFCLFVSLI